MAQQAQVLDTSRHFCVDTLACDEIHAQRSEQVAHVVRTDDGWVEHGAERVGGIFGGFLAGEVHEIASKRGHERHGEQSAGGGVVDEAEGEVERVGGAGGW